MNTNNSAQLKLIGQNLYLNGRASSIRLRPMEARLLDALLRHPNEPVSRAWLMREVWETSFVEDTRTLEVHIHYLRHKIEQEPSQPWRIITVRGIGYCLMMDETK